METPIAPTFLIVLPYLSIPLRNSVPSYCGFSFTFLFYFPDAVMVRRMVRYFALLPSLSSSPALYAGRHKLQEWRTVVGLEFSSIF